MNSPADNYWPELCAACSGTGKYQINLEPLSAKPRLSVAQQIADRSPNCVVCGGKAFVLVLQPAQKCLSMRGNRQVTCHALLALQRHGMDVRAEGTSRISPMNRLSRNAQLLAR